MHSAKTSLCLVWEENSEAYTHTFGGSISGERAPPQYCSTGELHALIRSACFTAL